jgi:PAT family beta-lactamase induction signal transducer AmpG
MIYFLLLSLESWTGLEPMQFTVQSSNTAQTEMVMPTGNAAIAPTDEMTFIAFPENLVLSTNNISVDSLNKIKTFASEQNQANGFVAIEKTAAEIKKDDASWWTHNVSAPLGHFIKTNFGEKREIVSTTDGKVGNAGLVAVRLSKKPEPGQDVVLNSSFGKGDKSISLLSGERIVFNESNWDKPAYLVVQLDYKLKDEVKSEFKGISGNIKLAWSITFFILAGMFILFFVYHRFVLPKPASDHATATHSATDILREFGRTFKSFFQKPGVGLAITFMLLYRLGEAMLVKMASPFLLYLRV